MRRRNSARTAALAITASAVLAVGLGGCGTEDATSPSPGGATQTGGGRTGADVDTVARTSKRTLGGDEALAEVTLGSPGEMSIGMPSSVKAGTVVFEVRNDGEAPHEFVLLRTDTRAGGLQVTNNRAAEPGLVGRTGELAPGAEDELEVDLRPGRYVVLCNVPGHYAAGMRKDLLVE
jgi:uncharacterized cupredoxin-like copper-binding protein